jgi:PAS domain S-box-containing protein
MTVLVPTKKDNIIAVSPDTPLAEILIIMQESEHALSGREDIFSSHECVFVIDKSCLLGIFTVWDLLRLVTSGVSLLGLKISHVMTKPVMTLKQSEVFDTTKILSLMRSYNLRYLPIVDDVGQLLGVVTPESIVIQLESELSNTKQALQKEIAQRCSTELILTKAVNNAQQALQVCEERFACAINAGKVGIWEWNIQSNKIHIDVSLQTMLGYSEEEIPKYFNDWLNFVHPDDIYRVKTEINAYLEGAIGKYEIEHRVLSKNGNYLWFIARGDVVRDTEDNPCFMAGSNTDITHYKAAEHKLKESLKEKEVLLKEIHHRVKNNLQVISSLLRLQAGYIRDEQALDIFQDSQNRIRAMAMIHENLYQSNDLAKIDFYNYIQNLANNLISSYGIQNKSLINLNLNIDKILLKIVTAIPCGLIINELVSNSIKHAFTGRNSGDIYIDFLELEPKKYSLIVSDNGIGVPDDIEVRRNQSLGLQLVWSLVEQLEGSIAFKNQKGTVFTITFYEET